MSSNIKDFSFLKFTALMIVEGVWLLSGLILVIVCFSELDFPSPSIWPLSTLILWWLIGFLYERFEAKRKD